MAKLQASRRCVPAHEKIAYISAFTGARWVSGQRAKLGLPTYRYHFVQVPQNGSADLGVAHFYEIPYVRLGDCTIWLC